MILELFEKIDVRKGIGPVVTDFQNSDAPQFKGKSKKEIRDMALAAYFAKKEGTEPDYIKAFLAKGGKIKKLPPGKAAGYHGKDDPGAGIKGMLAKDSAKKLGLKRHGKHLDTSTPVHKEGKAYSPTGVSYYVPKGHPDEVDPKTRQKKTLKHGSPEGEALKKVIARKEKAFKDLSKKETSEATVSYRDGAKYLAPKTPGFLSTAAQREQDKKMKAFRAHRDGKTVPPKTEAYGQPSDRMKAKNNAYKLKLKRDHEYEMKHGRKKDKRGIGENTSDVTYAASMHFDNPGIKVKNAGGGKYHVPMKSYHTKKDAQSFASQNGLKLHSHEKTMGGSRATVSVESTMKTFDEIRESTNWKGGSKHIGLARYSANQGYGVQITQIKAMPGDKMNWAKGAGFVKMPVKDIPKLCKALMNVYKAPANVQLGDDD